MTSENSSLFSKPFFSRFVLKFLLFGITCFVVDRSLGGLYRYFFNRQTKGPEYQTRMAMEVTTDEVLVFGSSRAEWMINPRIIQDTLGMSCYNVGRMGKPIMYHYAILQSALKRYSPKMAILSLDGANFIENKMKYEELSSLFPYYRSHPEIRPMADLKEKNISIKLLSAMYPYNSLFFQILAGNTNLNNDRYELAYKGFNPRKSFFSDFEKDLESTRDKAIDTLQVSLYRRFIADCKNYKIDLYMVCAPYQQDIRFDKSLQLAKSIAAENKIPFFDRSFDSAYVNHPDLFLDFRHLNARGADMLTTDIVKQIKAIRASRTQ